MENLVVVVPARAGSKRLKNKNRAKVGNRSLLERTLEIVAQLNSWDTCIFTTDDEILLEQAKSLGLPCPELRPKRLSTDEATTTEVTKYALSLLNTAALPEYLLLLQLTSPFRNITHIKKAIQLLETRPELSAVVSASKSKIKSFKTITDVHKFEMPSYQKDREDSFVDANGNFYLVRTKKFLSKESFFPEITTVLFTSEVEAIDIDVQSDLREAQRIAKIFEI